VAVDHQRRAQAFGDAACALKTTFEDFQRHDADKIVDAVFDTELQTCYDQT
jgi:hypothetical protein